MAVILEKLCKVRVNSMEMLQKCHDCRKVLFVLFCPLWTCVLALVTDIEFPSEKLARMAGMTAPLPETASRKAKSWEQVSNLLFKLSS